MNRLHGLLVRALVALAVACSAGVAACDISPSDLASFLSDDFGKASDSVIKLDEAGVASLVNDVMTKFRAYQDLRNAVPFDALSDQACVTDFSSSETRLAVVVDGACAFVAPAAGELDAVQDVVATDPVGVIRTTFDYVALVANGIHVAGREVITDTDGTDGASVRKLTLEQDGITFDYEFRMGVIDGDVPVFDYVLHSKGGDVLARLTNPSSVGALATLILTGLDGSLTCEVRNSDPTRPARGTCDNGVVFGLPH